MAYVRPVNQSPLSKQQKVELLRAYTEHYRNAAAADQKVLNSKLPREAFSDLLEAIGALLIEGAERAAGRPGPVREFLDANPLPKDMAPLLPDSFRSFCLALNALKQWVVKEQLATDRYLLGGVSRQMCRDAAETCLVTSEPLGPDAELHHPVRDGRPPVIVSKAGHAQIEGQQAVLGTDATAQQLIALRRQMNLSWAHLRRGCLDLLGTPLATTSKGMAASARSYARKASAATKLDYQELIDWLNEHGL